jgi:hypothetical protein
VRPEDRPVAIAPLSGGAFVAAPNRASLMVLDYLKGPVPSRIIDRAK